MKITVTSGYKFRALAPLAIDFTGAPAVTPTTLLAVLDATNRAALYKVGSPTLGGVWEGRTLVLDAALPAATSSDQLVIVIDDGRTAAGDDTLSAFGRQAHQDALDALAVAETLATENTLKGLCDDVNNFAAHNRQDLTKLDADLNAFSDRQHADELQIDADLNTFAAHNRADLHQLDADVVAFAAQNHGDLTKLDADLNTASDRNHADIVAASNRNHVDLLQVDTDLNAASTLAHQDSGRLDGDLNTFAGATHADLGRIEALLAAQRQETLWTDDSRAYFVRLDTRGAITWTDLSGNAGPAPGLGARPAAGDDALLDKSSYQAVNAGAGYAVGDLIDHVITTDPKSGAVVGHFWLNLTAETTIAAPVAADLEPLSRLPDDAARASLQSSIGATAHADALKIDGDIVAASDRAHQDAVTAGQGRDTVAAQAHADAVAIDGDVKAASDRNHADFGTLAAATGAPADAPAPDDVAPASIVALLRRGLARWTTFLGRFPAALGQFPMGGSISTTIAADQTPIPTLPFAPVRGATVSLTVGPAATANPVALAANVATSYRVRNAATSASPATWVLVPNNADGHAVPAIPTPFDATGAGGTPGDKSIDPGGVEIIALSAAQAAALQAGALFLSAICPVGGSAVLSITPGAGA